MILTWFCTYTLRYVITVPSMWELDTIQAMKKALCGAGIIRYVDVGEDDCMVVLEPEAASVFAKKDAERRINERNPQGEIIFYNAADNVRIRTN